jgi:hypothetical protein
MMPLFTVMVTVCINCDSGAQIPFSPMSRKAAQSSLVAESSLRGPPSIFLTIAPDGVHAPQGIRMTFGSKSNTEFPAVDGGLLGALEAREGTFIDIPVNNAALLQRLTKNPIQVVIAFHEVIEHLFTDVVGLVWHSQTKLFNRKVEIRPLCSEDARFYPRKHVATDLSLLGGRKE